MRDLSFSESVASTVSLSGTSHYSDRPGWEREPGEPTLFDRSVSDSLPADFDFSGGAEYFDFD